MAVVVLLGTLGSFAVLLVGLMILLGRLPRTAPGSADEAARDAYRPASAVVIFAAVAAVAIGLAILPFVLADEVSDGVALGVVLAQLALVGGGTAVGWIVGSRAARAQAR